MAVQGCSPYFFPIFPFCPCLRCLCNPKLEQVLDFSLAWNEQHCWVRNLGLTLPMAVKGCKKRLTTCFLSYMWAPVGKDGKGWIEALPFRDYVREGGLILLFSVSREKQSQDGQKKMDQKGWHWTTYTEGYNKEDFTNIKKGNTYYEVYCSLWQKI